MDVTLLKQKKKELGLTYKQIANLAGLPLRTVENVFMQLSNHHHVETVQAIEAVLGLNQIPPEFKATTVSARELINIISTLTDEECAEVIRFIDYVISKRK